ncbi:MAG: hypothetical protein ACU0GG_10465 [Paracoccaceae bacterium]
MTSKMCVKNKQGSSLQELQRVRRERDFWLETVIADSKVQKVTYRIAAFVSLRLNISNADFRWAENSIAQKLNIDARTVRLGFKELKECGYLFRKGRHGARGTQIYGISFPSLSGQPCPVQPANLEQASPTGQACPVDCGIVNETAPPHHTRPDKNESSTGQKKSFDRTAMPPIPIEPYEPSAEGGCAFKAQQTPSAESAKRITNNEKSLDQETMAGAPREIELTSNLDQIQTASIGEMHENERRRAKLESPGLRQKIANEILEDAGFTKERFAENSREKARRKRNQTVDWLQ